MNKRIIGVGLALVAAIGLSGCGSSDDADIVNHNITKAADNFELNRRIVIVNGITDKYLLEVEGRCQVEPGTGKLFVTCKVADGTGPDSYKRHQLYKSDNVFAVVEQLDAVETSAYHYRYTYKPQEIIPDVDVRVDTSEGPQTQD